MMEQFLNRHFERRVITPDCPEGKVGKPLMTRWFLLRTKYLGVFVHKFHRSDLDEFHDHPWTFVTILLSHGYWEHIPFKSKVWRPRWSVLFRPATFQHFVSIEKPTWTLVIRFKNVRRWGFWIKGVFYPWREVEQQQSRSICE